LATQRSPSRIGIVDELATMRHDRGERFRDEVGDRHVQYLGDPEQLERADLSLTTVGSESREPPASPPTRNSVCAADPG